MEIVQLVFTTELLDISSMFEVKSEHKVGFWVFWSSKKITQKVWPPTAAKIIKYQASATYQSENCGLDIKTRLLFLILQIRFIIKENPHIPVFIIIFEFEVQKFFFLHQQVQIQIILSILVYYKYKDEYYSKKKLFIANMNMNIMLKDLW